jgi:DNA-binding response OmpR family regulator
MNNPARVLVVDDNEMNRDMLSRRLQRQGYTVEVAVDGLNALEMIQQQDVDLILLDIMMPRMNGYEVLSEIKSDEKLLHIPVVMISAVDDLDSVVRCIEMGAEDYLFKPFNPVLLKARVGASLEKKRLRDRQGADEAVVTAVEQIEIVLADLRAALTPQLDGQQKLQSGFDEINRLLDELKQRNS